MKNKLSKNISFFDLPLLIFILISLSLVFLYNAQPEKNKETIQSITLDYFLDPLRENTYPLGPHFLHILDLICDQFPIQKKPVIFWQDDQEMCDLTNTSTSHTPHPSLIFGAPQSNTPYLLLYNQAYTVGYDEFNKNPAWVAFYIFQPNNDEFHPRPDTFSIDYRTQSRISPNDYKNSGFDRGHMAPNYAISQSYGPSAQKETFLMSNIVPQLPDLNRKTWKYLELRQAQRFLKLTQSLWIFVGPIYLSSNPQYIKNKIRIPDAFFNIVLDQLDNSNGFRALSFIIPSNPSNTSSPLKQYLTSIDHIESLTGINFFPNLPEPYQSQLESYIAPRLW